VEGYATADQVWGAALVFARLGAILMLLPGIGETYVPPRIRLSLALLITLVVWPIAAPVLPALPASIGGMAGWVIREVATGLMIGAILRAFMTALATAGEVVSLQTTLSFAQSTNPMQAQPGSTLLLFATNTHHLFLAGLAGSYELIAPVRPLITADFVELAVRTLADSFMLGIQLAAPVIVFAIIFNLASGLVGRVMPQFQVFFATAPLSILLGLSIFTLSLGVVGTIFIDRYRSLAQIFAGGAGG